MFFCVTGDLLQSSAEALVNTVNCEGYMGKGIAYQFKLKFPQNNIDYTQACKKGMLKPGKLHYYCENGKIIINFPTKDKWRNKSKLNYIEDGLDALILLIENLNIKSIAIPPLGSGNGGLIWLDVKKIISEKLEETSRYVDIYLYEPSKSYSAIPTLEPKLSTSALVLMEIKLDLKKFTKLRLQKTAYFMNLMYNKSYFKFQAHKYGPYSHSIDVISKKIREFQLYHKTKTTEEAKVILYNKLISDSVKKTLDELLPYIKKASFFVNNIESDHELECLSTICYLLEQEDNLTADNIIFKFKLWSEEKAQRFSEEEILAGLERLNDMGILSKTLMGYSILNSNIATL